LPRGSGGRTAFETQTDLHIAYARKLGDVEAELYFELFNLFNTQFETTKDEEWTTDVVHPISRGGTGDLPYARTATSGVPASKKLNYGNTTARNAPLTGRFGITLTF